VVLKNVVAEHCGCHCEDGKRCAYYPQRDRTAGGGTEAPEIGGCGTLPYPGFPTDLQQPFVAAMCVADGTSVVRETILTASATSMSCAGWGRYQDGTEHCIVRGVPQLTGAPWRSLSLRAGAALAIAALAAQGVPNCTARNHRRGYEYFEEKLRALGANIYRSSSPPPGNW